MNCEELQATVAHEVFHIFQFAMGLTWSDKEKNDLGWLMEATAQWSEHYVYPNPCLPPHPEHAVVDKFFATLDQDRLLQNGLREYASYMLFFFLSDHKSGTAYISAILHAVSDNPSGDIGQTIMNQVADFREIYGEFALYNWNWPPFHRYSDFIAPQAPAGSSKRTYTIQAPMKLPFQDIMQRGSIKYHVFDINTSITNVERMTFDFSEMNLEKAYARDCPYCDEGRQDLPDSDRPAPTSPWLMRQAYIKIEDQWLPEAEDWTHIAERTFDRRDEYVTEIVLIISHADLRPHQECEHDFLVIA